MATCAPRFTWCACRKHKIPIKDTHELCLHCLGIQHAKEAVLEYGKCPHCAKMDWSTCINRLTKVQEVMHRESQQKKSTEAIQSDVQPKPETTSAPVSESKPTSDPVASIPASHLPTSSSAHPSTMPVMFTILSPPPSQTGTSSCMSKGLFLSQLAIQQPADSNPTTSQPSSHALPTSSHKRHRVSSHHSRCSRCCKRRRVAHQRRCSSTSSSSSQGWTSDDSCASGAGRRSQRGSRHRSEAERRCGELVEVVQQKLEAQQRAVQLQWALLEKRIEALERRGGEAASSVHSQTARTYTSAFPATSSQELQTDISGLASGQLVTESTSQPIIKQEEQPSSVSSASRGEGEGDASQAAEGSISSQDLLEAKELQSLIARAARCLGIDFPSTSSNPCSPPSPTMLPDFEDLIQSSWQNPASSKPYREVFSKMYRLNDCQSPSYDHMPQVSCLMSAIFQAAKPTERKEILAPPEQWQFAEMVVEKIYQTSGMLAKTANYLRYLSDYQRKLLVEITEDHPAQRFVEVLNELKLIGHFTLQLSSHQAELSGRVMSASVAVRRQVWMAKTNYTDSLKATVADLPFVVSHAPQGSSGPSSSGTVCKQEPV